MRVPAAMRRISLLLCLVTLSGCRLPGRPKASDIPQRPDAVTNFHTLYNTNCAACHGTNGRNGMSVSLSNPAYLAYAGEKNIAAITAAGIPGSLMPAFAKASGGLLTDEQVQILAHGMVTGWADTGSLHGGTPPAYLGQTKGDPTRGQALYRAGCLHCHADTRGSLLDPTYLALITDGGLRTLIITGVPEQGMPNWQGYGGGPLTDQTVADLVAFLSSHRSSSAHSTPEQPLPVDGPTATVQKTASNAGS